MELEVAVTYVNNYGYFALLMILWVGFFGIPVPNEAIVMTSGFIASKDILSVIPTLIVTYVGVLLALTTLYILGRFFFNPLQKRLANRPKFQEYMGKARRLIENHGPVALIVSYPLPGVRHFVPFMAGSIGMSFRVFGLYAYSIASVWTAILFFIGYYFGMHIDLIIERIYMIGIPLFLLVVSFLYGIYQLHRKYSLKQKGH